MSVEYEYEFNHTWSIYNFSTYRENDVLKSFWTVLDGGVSWCIVLHPHGDGSTKNSVSIFLKCLTETKIDITVSFAFLDVHKRQIFELTKTGSMESRELGFSNFFERSNLDNNSESYLPHDTFTLYCKIVGDSSALQRLARMSLIKVPEWILPTHLVSCLKNNQFSDVTLSADGQTFHAHKVILSTRSPVFKAMFDHDMAENQNNCVVIADVKQEVIKEMLRFLYTGTVGDIDAFAGELLAVAEKYNLERLKSMCEQVLCRDLTIENAVETLVLADLHSAKTLKAQTFTFIIDNAEDFVDNIVFQSLQVSHPHLLLEAFRASIIP